MLLGYVHTSVVFERFHHRFRLAYDFDALFTRSKETILKYIKLA